MKRYSLIVALGAAALFVVALIGLWYQGKRQQDMVIADHVAQLDAIFDKIDTACKIIGFDHQQNYIDFLNVKSFSGSAVGSMNLEYPKKWQGPYLESNLTMQQKYYQVVRTKYGYFVVPGPGVRLTNGKIIGKDILFDQDADIPSMISDGTLQFQGRPLAVQILDNAVIKVPEGDTEQDRLVRDRLKNL